MGTLRYLILAVVVLMLAAKPCTAQRDPEKPPPQILQPAPPVPAAPDKAERPFPALAAFVAVSTALVVLVTVCKPSRKGIPS